MEDKEDDTEEVDEEWFENSFHVNGIFRSCEVTWKKLDWPGVKIDLEFGISILKKLIEVLQFYISSLFDIVYEDRLLDKAELAAILGSIHFSSRYLSDAFADVSSVLEEEDDNLEKTEAEALVREMDSVRSRSSALAESYTAEFITVFCQVSRVSIISRT